MKLRQLEFVKAVADSSSFSRAAEICNATQPTLSNSISQLETELGGRLFTRTTRMVELTPFGTYLLPSLSAVLTARQELEKAAAAYHNPVHKLLRIGFSPLVDSRLLDQVLQPYRQRHPDISIFYKECLLDDLEQRLNGNLIDMAIVPRGTQDLQKNGFDHFPFYSNPLYYLPCDEGDTARTQGPWRISALPDSPVIMTGGGCGLNGSLETLFEREGAKLRAYPGQAISYQVIEEWTQLGIGAGILPAAKLSHAKLSHAKSSHERDAASPLLLDDDRPAVFTYDWIWPRTGNAQPHITALIDYAKTTVPVLINGGNCAEAIAEI